MKLAKILIGSTFAIPAIVTPLTTLTGCSQTWGNKTPFMIGSTLPVGSPYRLFLHDANGFLDADRIDMANYLQSNYAVQTNNGSYYAYSTPKKWTSDEERHDWNDDGNSGWYNSADPVFNSIGTYKDEDDKPVTVTNAQNATLAANINFISQIGYNIATYLSFALQYQASQARVDESGEGDDSQIKIAWGNKFELDHGTKDPTIDSQNSKFYEYIFALANLIGPDKANALLRTSAVDFCFHQNKMPLPTYDWSSGKRAIHKRFAQLLEGKDDFSEPQYYSTKQEDTEMKDEEEIKYTIYSYKNVPVIVNFNNIKETYVNPTKSADSFIVNDYYSSKKETLESIGNQWKDKLPAFTGLEKDDCVPHIQTFELHRSEGNRMLNFGVDKYDQRLGEVHGDEFICLLSYNVKIYEDAKYQDKNSASINQLDSFFPAYFLEIAPELKDDSLKGDIFKEIVRDDTPTGYYTIDSDKVNKINTWFINLIKRESAEGRIADITKLKDDSKLLLNFLSYMFNKGDSVVNTNWILDTTNLPEE